MKKTHQSPENTELTPSKKKLKQARLPFMVVSDVSPKTETPPSRKRKLSVPEPEPLPKIGKLSEKRQDSEDLVVISDDEVKDGSSLKKVVTSVNPYVKLVDTARKKKLQKAKSQKSGKNKSSKRESKNASKKKLTEENNVNSEYDDVEMVDVDVIIHEKEEVSKDDLNKVTNGVIEPESVSKQSETRNNSPKKKNYSKAESASVSGNTTETTVENIVSKETTDKNNDKVSEVICLEDSNNSSDVKLIKNTNSKSEKQNVELKEPTQQSKRKNNSPKPKVNKVAPKRSSRNKTKDALDVPETSPSTNQDKDLVASKVSPKDTPSTPTKTNATVDDKYKTNKSENDSDSDIEMIQLDEEKEKLEKSNNTAKTKLGHSNEAIEQSSDDMDASKTEEMPSTPKRSMRNKNKTEEINDLDVSTVSSKLDGSIVSSPATPKHNKSLSEKEADKSVNESAKPANLTPKQLQKKLESAKKREEREKERLEREKKRQQEKEERAKQRQEKEDQRKREREEKEEAKRKEKEEKEEQRKKERDEKEKLKEMERKAKEMKEELKRKEKEDKEEQRKKEKEARDEEKRKKQEAMELEKQEQELKKKKAAEAFVNFFVPKQKVQRGISTDPVSKSSLLSSFTIKSDMRLAPTTRTRLSEDQRDGLDKVLSEPTAGDLYLKCLKDGSAKPLSSGKTWPLEDKDDDDVMIIEDELPPIDVASEVIACESAPREKLRPKLLSFHENRRPPYWGTWRKKSKLVRPRRPFGQEKQLDYEVDSDDDWEDEADGESLDGSAGGSDDEAGTDDYEVDNEVFVPHGYLSDEEATMDEDDRDVLSLSPDAQKARLKHLEDEFESELKKPTEKLKPRLYGLLWETPEGGKPDNCVDALWNYFNKFAMIMNDPTPFLQPSQEKDETEKKKIKKKKVLVEVNEQSPKEKKKKTENKESKKPKQEVKKTPNQPGINSFLKKINST